MEKQITIIVSEDKPIEDLFRGQFTCHAVAGKENTFVLIKVEE